MRNRSKFVLAAELDALDALQDELETVLRGAAIGPRDGTIGHEFVRDELGMRRESLKRHAGHDGNVVTAKTAQSA